MDDIPLEKVEKAIEFLSSLPSTSSGSRTCTSRPTDGQVGQKKGIYSKCRCYVTSYVVGLIAHTSDALNALATMRAGLKNETLTPRKRATKKEIDHVFRKKQKISTWCHIV